MNYINITEEELNKLKYVGSGTFGTIRTDGEIIIKRYHELVKTEIGIRVINPCLKIKKNKFRRLNSRNKKIEYTDTFIEPVFLNGKFIGIKKKYYDGDILSSLNYSSLQEKKECSLKLIRNSEELTDHKIYHLDIKTNNIIVCKNGEVRFIDLDDCCTKATLFSNPYYKMVSLKRLKKTILDLFYYNQLDFSESIAQRISSSPENDRALQKVMSYEELRNFVCSFQMEQNICVIRTEDIFSIDLSFLKDFLIKNKLVLVLAHNKNDFSFDFLFKVFDYIESCNISVYDIFSYRDYFLASVKEYIFSHDCSDVYSYENDFYILQKK